ncbi:MAG TPA: nucleotidyltransferase domain-containing protein [Pirellulales bacterium]|nr:nucleotidyltransferase domain-containing protein [Pirellulales bacterium]
MLTDHLVIPIQAIDDVCRRHHVRRLLMFGSALSQRFCAESDVDLVVEYEAGRTPGFVGLGMLEVDLSPLFEGHKVDLHTTGSLNREFRDRVIAQAQVLFDSQPR